MPFTTFVLLALGAAPAPGLADARRHYDAFEFDRCVKTLERAPRKSLTQRERAEVELFFGLCRFNLGQDKQAEAHFELALRLEPSLELPPMTSPKIEAVWGRVKRELGSVATPAAEKQPPPDAPVVEAKPPVTQAPAVVQAAVPVVEPRRRSYVLPVVLGGAAAVASGTAAILGVQASGAQATARSATYQAEIIAANDRAAGFATGANVAWGIAGALALGAGVALIVELAR